MGGARTRRIRVGQLTDEEWEARDREAGWRLRVLPPADALSQPVVNIHRFHQKMAEAVNIARSKDGRQPKWGYDVDPFERVRLLHVRRPGMDALLAAADQGGEQRAERHLCRFSADGWRNHVRSVT